ncbi:MAG: FtsX-like permease family protein, partial [Lachnospiraceae bacterium]|nr:FtsX-like permease family protein [Lachnospiraceae bacterium]
IGDKLKISAPDREMEFTIGAIAKDAVFGSAMIGPKRIFIGKEDYDYLMGDAERYHTRLYSVNCSDVENFGKEFKKQNLEITIGLDKPTLKMCYFFDLLMAGILVIIGICLILVSFLILRFTIVFTLQEDYKEIGIMKAIGIRDMRIKGIYLLKYFAIALAGSAIGMGLSFPFSRILLAQVMDDFVISAVGSGFFIHLLCAVLIVLVVILFCYSCTGKIKKFTAVEAIRNGGNGERYHAGAKLKLNKRAGMLPCVYLACNDVVSHMRRYLILAVIFCIGTMEILLPLTTLHTLKDDSIIRTFSVQPSTFHIDTGGLEQYLVEENDALLRKDIEALKTKLADNGFKAQVWIEVFYMAPCYGRSADEQTDANTMQQLGEEEDDYDVLEGSVPVLENEIMVTEKTAQDLGVSIGDYVHYRFPDGEKDFIVTGIYQSMMNMGRELRVSKDAQMPYKTISGLLSFQVKIESDLKPEALRAELEDIFPDYEISTDREWVDDMIGVTQQMDALQVFITAVVLIINMLITVLMVKTLIARERGEIAMLKSIGFADKTIRGWQSMRILIVLFAAILAGSLLSGILDSFIIGSIFSIMGATSIHLVKKPLETYVLYPALMLAVTGITAYLCAAKIKSVDVKEINTLE